MVLGIDGGGTRTRCLIADRDGSVLGQGEQGTSNPFYGDDARLEEVLAQAVWLAIQNADAVSRLDGRIEAIWAGVAGVAESQKGALVEAMLRRIVQHPPGGVWPAALKPPNPDLPVGVSSDFLTALVAGAGERRGVVVISGTGSVMYGETEDGRSFRAGGWGPYLDDAGSGNQIGHQALRAVVQAYDGRAAQTLLTDLILAEWQMKNPRALFRHILAQPPTPARVAQLVGPVQTAALAGDKTAQGLLTAAGQGLAQGVGAVARQLELGATPFSVVLSGGVLQNVEMVVTSFEQALGQVFPLAQSVRLTQSPAMGAVRLALHSMHHLADLT